MRAVAVDFDGVIHDYSKGWQDGSIYGEPLPGAFDALRGLMEDYAVFIFTSRSKYQVADWLEGRGFAVKIDDGSFYDHDNWDGRFWDEQGILLVTNSKLGASCYVDDRGIRFEDWEQALADVRRLVQP